MDYHGLSFSVKCQYCIKLIKIATTCSIYPNTGYPRHHERKEHVVSCVCSNTQVCIIHSNMYAAPLQGNYSEALPTPVRTKRDRFSNDLKVYPYMIFQTVAALEGDHSKPWSPPQRMRGSA